MNIYSILSSIPHNPHYLERYINFIEGCKQKNIDIEGYVERHHICPKSLFPEYEKFSEHSWNGIHLTARQHFIAHWILWKALPKSNIFFAFWSMCNGWNTKNKKQKISSKIYEKLKTDFSAQISIRHSGKNNPMYGKKHSPETIQKLKEKHHRLSGKDHSCYGKHHTEETRRKMSVSQSGKNNGMYGKHHTEEAKQKISTFRLTYIISEETKKKMSESHTGKTLSEDHKQKIRNSNIGQKRSEESKQKMRDSRKGIVFSEEHKKNLSIATKGENNPMYGADRSGENNPMYGKKGKNNPNFGKKRLRKICPHCGKDVGVNIYYKCHGDKCKLKI